MNRSARSIYLLPIFLYLCLSTLYLLAIPTGESPDEPSHLQCIEQVTLYNRIPIIEPKPKGDIWWARERIISGLVCAHMPLYYLMTGYTQQLVQTLSGVPAHFEFPPNDPGWATGESKAMFLHPARTSVLQLDEPAALVVLRLESMLLGLVSIWGAYRVARAVAPDAPQVALAAMTLVAGWPQFLFMSRALNNDALATALSVACLVALLESGKPRRFVLAGILAALAVLAKITMIFTVVFVILVFVLEAATCHKRAPYWRSGLASLAVFGLLGALILFQPTLRSHLEWSQATMASTAPAAGAATYWLDVAHATIQSGWARFGWMNVITPDLPAYLWWLVLIAGMLTGVMTGLRSAAGRETRLQVIIGAIWIAAVAAVYVSINLNRFQPQFRYAFAVVPAMAGFAASGLFVVLRRFDRLTRLVPPILAAVLLAANVWLVFGVLAPLYS